MSPSPAQAAALPGLRALLDEILDYAGLFPPAALSLDAALRNFARYRYEPEAWMLGRFVLPAARLPELRAYEALLAAGPPFRFAVLGTGGDDPAAFARALAADLEAVEAFLAAHPHRVTADVLEVRLPASLLADGGAAARGFFDTVAGQLTVAPVPRPDVFFEIPLTAGVPPALPELLGALAGRHPAFGLKLRTGGLEPAAFPDAAAVATVIAGCRDHGVRFKATAGLHHPVRRFDASVGTHMYGFFNVFGAAVLAAAHDLDAGTLASILLDESAGHFRVDEGGFAWRDLVAPPEAIRRARTTLAVSFGSCSFDEPRDDLRALGLL